MSAILDVNVGGDKIDPVAEIIASRGLPFIFASGYGAVGALEKFRHVPVLQKPFLMERLGDAIDETPGKVSEGNNQNDGQPASH